MTMFKIEFLKKDLHQEKEMEDILMVNMHPERNPFRSTTYLINRGFIIILTPRTIKCSWCFLI
jgi:hypothetical protein